MGRSKVNETKKYINAILQKNEWIEKITKAEKFRLDQHFNHIFHQDILYFAYKKLFYLEKESDKQQKRNDIKENFHMQAEILEKYYQLKLKKELVIKDKKKIEQVIVKLK